MLKICISLLNIILVNMSTGIKYCKILVSGVFYFLSDTFTEKSGIDSSFSIEYTSQNYHLLKNTSVGLMETRKKYPANMPIWVPYISK